jgi:hypothetical protein
MIFQRQRTRREAHGGHGESTMIAAALDLIIGFWLVIYVVPEVFDRETAGFVTVAIIVVGVLHTARRVG